MTTMSWLKGVVVAVGLSLTGGAAVAAGPTPVGTPVAAHFDRDNDGRGFGGRGNDGGRWNDNDGRYDNDWDGYRDGRFDGTNHRLFRLGRQKITEGRQLQAQAAELRREARWAYKPRLLAKANRMEMKGERLEREGRMMIRRARG